MSSVKFQSFFLLISFPVLYKSFRLVAHVGYLIFYFDFRIALVFARDSSCFRARARRVLLLLSLDPIGCAGIASAGFILGPPYVFVRLLRNVRINSRNIIIQQCY